jgi:predicted transposase/invertase (TIGR01784 family)
MKLAEALLLRADLKKNAENLDVIPENVDDEGLKEAYQDANKHSWTKEELEAYDYAAMREQDERGKTELAEKRGENKGKIAVAKKLKEMGISNEDIRNVTGLSEDEIENL